MEITELKEDEMRGRKPPIPLPDKFALAGGAVRRWFTGEKQDSDFDLFRMDEKEQFAIDLPHAYRRNSTRMAINYKWHGNDIQVIKRNYETIEEMFENFDFHHCQFAYYEGKIYTTKKAIICALRGHLSLNNFEEGFQLDTLRRAFKYQRQGFTPCRGTLAKLAKGFQDIQGDLDEQIVMSPSGGRRSIIRFD